MATPRGDVAQLAERRLCKAEVVGSIPIVSTREAAGQRPAGGSGGRPAPCGWRLGGAADSALSGDRRSPSASAARHSPSMLRFLSPGSTIGTTGDKRIRTAPHRFGSFP